MSLTSTTVLNRSKMVKATFPKGKITVDQAIDMVMAVADSQVGYNSGSGKVSLYGNGQRWATEGDWNWQGYWCARGISWVFDFCFGAEAATAGIGKQPYTVLPAGWAATWHWRDWLRSNGRWVGLERAQRGDISMQSWGRTANATDHVELVAGEWDGSSYPNIGFNTVSQGTSGVTSGAGVYRVRRTRYALVAIYRPDWERLVAVYNMTVAVQNLAEGVQDLTQYAQALVDLGYTADEAGIRKFQADEGLTVDGIVGPNTTQALEDKMSEVLDAVNDLRSLLLRQTTVPVSEATGENLHTGRTGNQPIGWFLNVLGNRIGRIDGIAYGLRKQVAEQAGTITGLQEALAQLTASPSVGGGNVEIDLDAVAAAAKRGTTDALRSADVSLSFGDEDDSAPSPA